MKKKILVSSAKSRSSVNLEALGRSFIKSMKNKGPKMDPWGTPQLMVRIEDKVWLIWTIADGEKSSFLSTAEPHSGYHSAPAWKINTIWYFRKLQTLRNTNGSRNLKKSEETLNEMTKRWLPPHTKPTTNTAISQRFTNHPRFGDQWYQAASPTERISSFVDSLLQPIAN